MTPISIPKLGISMTEGHLTEWHVQDGETVAAGALLYTLETDKTENEIEAPVGGVVHIHAVAGETYPVGTQIGHIEGSA